VQVHLSHEEEPKYEVSTDPTTTGVRGTSGSYPQSNAKRCIFTRSELLIQCIAPPSSSTDGAARLARARRITTTAPRGNIVSSADRDIATNTRIFNQEPWIMHTKFRHAPFLCPIATLCTSC
jgi:uncharacterized protein (DUF1499 family)